MTHARTNTHTQRFFLFLEQIRSSQGEVLFSKAAGVHPKEKPGHRPKREVANKTCCFLRCHETPFKALRPVFRQVFISPRPFRRPNWTGQREPNDDRQLHLLPTPCALIPVLSCLCRPSAVNAPRRVGSRATLWRRFPCGSHFLGRQAKTPPARRVPAGAIMGRGRITGLAVSDVRFPTSLAHHGSDAMHPDPDYSAAYVVLETDAPDGLKGYGLTFTLGKGTEVVVCAVNALAVHVVNKDLDEIIGDFRGFYRQLTSDGQLRWIGPEKGAVHLATAAVLNAIWDLWAKQDRKPLWKLLVDMDPKQLLSCIDFRYITDALTEEEAYTILQNGLVGKSEREEQMLKYGYPAYTTSCAWLGYPDQQLKQLCSEALKDGWTRFKVKVGADLQDDIRRCKLVREMIGPENIMMLDANQRWDVEEAIEWVNKLAEFRPLWIEEPTSPDDILGHATISKALAPLGIGVATGEQCHNRVIFKQFLQAQALNFVQVDSCRLGSVNENLSVLLMAKKFQVPVCPHAGGVGLCELVQHLIIFDYISVSGSLQNRMCEYVDHLHEHFKYPVVIKNASYMPPQAPGYSSEMKEDSARKYQFPQGEVWQQLLSDPSTAKLN